MKTYKRIDWIAQDLSIIIGLLAVVINLSSPGDAMTFAYALVAMVQIISVVVHFFYPASVKTTGRKIYLGALLLLIVSGFVAGAVNEFSIPYLFGLLFVTPVLAVFYTIVCYIETRKLESTLK